MNEIPVTNIHKKSEISEKTLYNYYLAFSKWFKTWDFSEVFPLLSEDCILEERLWWIFERWAILGKNKIVYHFKHKAKSDFELDEIVYWIWNRLRSAAKIEKLFHELATNEILTENIGYYRKARILTNMQIEMLPVSEYYKTKHMWLLVSQFFDNTGEWLHKVLIKLYCDNESWLINLIQIHRAAYFEVQHYSRNSEERQKDIKKQTKENLLQPSDLQIKACSLCFKYLLDKWEKLIYCMDGFEMTPHWITIDEKEQFTHYCVEWYIEWQKKWWEINPRILNYWIRKALINNANLQLLSVCFKPKSKTNKDKLYLNSKYDYEITPYKIPLMYHQININKEKKSK